MLLVPKIGTLEKLTVNPVFDIVDIQLGTAAFAVLGIKITVSGVKGKAVV